MSLAELIPFRGRNTGPIIDLTPEEIMPENLIDRAASATDGVLGNALSEEMRLVGQIKDLTEQLRQTRVVIDAFSPVQDKLVAGSKPTELIKATLKVDPATTAKRKGRG